MIHMYNRSHTSLSSNLQGEEWEQVDDSLAAAGRVGVEDETEKAGDEKADEKDDGEEDQEELKAYLSDLQYLQDQFALVSSKKRLKAP
jgi:hypothetical protein